MITKVALVGFGHLGKWHAEKSLHIFGENFKAVVEKDSTKHEAIKSKYPDLFVTDSIDEVLPLVNAVIIATPTSFHF